MAMRKYLTKSGLRYAIKKLLFGSKKIWHGTQEEWDALSSDEKDKYDQAEIEDISGIAAVDKVEDGNLNPVTSNAVYDDGDLSDYIDVSSTVTNADGATSYGLYGTPIVRYRKLGRHLMFLDIRFSIKYTTAVAAGTLRQEDFLQFKIPADIVHGDPYVSMTGYTRGSTGIVNPFLTYHSPTGATATIQLSVKVYHAIARSVNETQDFNFTGIVMVDKWLD